MIHAKEAHDLATDQVLKRELSVTILGQIKEEAGKGQYNLTLDLQVPFQELNDISKALRDKGFEANVGNGYLKNTLYIRW